jgi:RNA polymerase sigma factor (sigma-70 family)
MPVKSESIYDQWLVIRSQDGDVEALSRLVTRWQERLLKHSTRLLGHAEDAHDVVQEVWIAAARSIRKLEDPAHFRAWIYRIATHKCADRIRKSQRDRKMVEARKVIVEQRQHSTASDEVSLVREALKEMPNEQQVLLRLHYIEELGTAELGIVFDIPQGTVKSRLFHARRVLARLLERNQS